MTVEWGWGLSWKKSKKAIGDQGGNRELIKLSKEYRLGEFLFCVYFLLSYNDVFWIMFELWKLWILVLFAFFWNFPETTWRRMNCRQVAHVVAPSFWVFVWSAWRPAVTRQALFSLLLFLSLFLMCCQWCCGSRWYSYCTYMNCMTNCGLQFLNWWKLHELVKEIGG